MSQQTFTVSVEYLPQQNLIHMELQRFITTADMRQALAQINQIVNASSAEVVVMVNLLNTPDIPITTTVNSALEGPYTNPKLKEWLAVGQSPVARLIEKILVSVTGRRNVRWFDSEEEIFAYLESSLRNN